MSIHLAQPPEPEGCNQPPDDGLSWPAEVELIASALEAAGASTEGRRQMPRMPLRRRAALRLYADAPGAAPWPLYIRDANERGLGFVTPHRLPLGYGGTIELAGPSGHLVRLNCTLLRCRPVASGWFEGSLHFNREQPAFKVEQSSGSSEAD
jgi:hypothetical protein